MWSDPKLLDGCTVGMSNHQATNLINSTQGILFSKTSLSQTTVCLCWDTVRCLAPPNVQGVKTTQCVLGWISVFVFFSVLYTILGFIGGVISCLASPSGPLVLWFSKDHIILTKQMITLFHTHGLYSHKCCYWTVLHLTFTACKKFILRKTESRYPLSGQIWEDTDDFHDTKLSEQIGLIAEMRQGWRELATHDE